MELGNLAVFAAEQLARRLDSMPATSTPSITTIVFCTQTHMASFPGWRRMVLGSDPVSPPPSSPDPGVELVSGFVIAQLHMERSALPPEQRSCQFCNKPVDVDDELVVYLYQRTVTAHLMVLAFHCTKETCLKEREAWLGALKSQRKKHGNGQQHHCSQCGKDSGTTQRFLACSKCFMVNYCSEECHRMHWKLHKVYCKSVQQASVTF